MTSHRPTWIVILTGAILAGVAVDLWWVVPKVYPGYRGDWPVIWWMATMPISATHPMPYPPTALFLFRPFGLLPLWPAFAVWTTAGLLLFVGAARRLGIGAGAIALALAMPCALQCVAAGQTSLFVGAALMGGVAARDWRWSGVLLGVAMAVKPQSGVAVPLALMAIGDWRRLFMVGATGLIAVAVSVAAWGISAWTIWVGAMTGFRAYLIQHHLDVMDVGANGVRLMFGLPWWVHAAGAVLGAVMVVATWRGTRDPVARYGALACGAALISPYTLVYDLAGLSLVAATMLTDRRRGPGEWVAAAPLLIGLWPNPGVIGLGGVLAWMNRRGVIRGRGDSGDNPGQPDSRSDDTADSRSLSCPHQSRPPRAPVETDRRAVDAGLDP